MNNNLNPWGGGNEQQNDLVQQNDLQVMTSSIPHPTPKRRPKSASGLTTHFDSSSRKRPASSSLSSTRPTPSTSSSHFQFTPNHNRYVGSSTKNRALNIVRPFPKNRRFTHHLEQLTTHSSIIDHPESPQTNQQHQQSHHSLSTTSSLHLNPSFSKKTNQIINNYKRRNDLRRDLSPAVTKRRQPRPQSALSYSSHRRKGGWNGNANVNVNGNGNGNGNGHANGTAVQRRPKTAGNRRDTGRLMGSSLFDRNNNSADAKLRNLQLHLRKIVQVKSTTQHVTSSGGNNNSLNVNMNMDIVPSVVLDSQSKFAPGLKTNTDHFIHWLSNDWRVDSKKMQREAIVRRGRRRRMAEEANAERTAAVLQEEKERQEEQAGQEGKRKERAEEDYSSDEYSDAYSDSEEEEERQQRQNKMSRPVVDDFTSWVSDAWPGVMERRVENGTKDSHTYPSEELMLMSRLCSKYGKQVSDRLVHGFQHDLRVELKQQQLEHGGSGGGVLGRGGGINGANHYPAHSHRVRLLDRWFDLALQQLIHNEPKLEQQAVLERKKKAKEERKKLREEKERQEREEHEEKEEREREELEGKNQGKNQGQTTWKKATKTAESKEKKEKVKKENAAKEEKEKEEPPTDPIAESCKKLWSTGLVPLHIIGASEAVQLIQEKEVGSDLTKFAPLADLVQRLFLGLLQSTNDVLAVEVARRVRAEKLAQDIGQELSKMKAAKSGWAKAKKVGGRLSVMRLLRKTTDQQVKEQHAKRMKAAMEMDGNEKLKLLHSSNFLNEADKLRIALDVLRNSNLLNDLLLAMNSEDYHHLLDLHEESEEEEGFGIMKKNMMEQVPGLIESNPDVLADAGDHLKSLAVASLLSGSGTNSTLTQLLMKQLSAYNEGRAKNKLNVGSDSNAVMADALAAAQEVALQIQQSVVKVPHSSDWKAAFRKQLCMLMKENSLHGGGRDGDFSSSAGSSANNKISAAVDDFADVLDKSLLGILGGPGGKSAGGKSAGGKNPTSTDDAHTREALATFGRHLVGRLNGMDKRLLDSILLSEQAMRRSKDISLEWQQGLLNIEKMPWWETMMKESAARALDRKREKTSTVETQTTKMDFIKSGGHSGGGHNGGGHSGGKDMYGRRRTQILQEKELDQEYKKEEVLGLSHLLARHYEAEAQRKNKKNKKRKPKKKKIPRITTTIKSFGAMVGEMVQAKYLADSVDHASGQKPQPFPDFLQQYFQLKFGKQHARAYQMGMKQMSKVAAEVEHYYDKSSRVRIFARAAGILVCCEGGICSCKCPNLLNAHIEAIARFKKESKEINGQKVVDHMEHDVELIPPISKSMLSTGRGITRFRKEMAEFWVDLVAAAFNLPSTKSSKNKARSSSVGSQNGEQKRDKKAGVVKQQDKDKLSQVLGDGTQGPVFVPANRLLKRCMQEMPWLKEPENNKHKSKLEFLVSNLAPRRVDSLEKLHVCLDTACDALCDFWDRETERHHAEKMDYAARTIEKIWYRAKACERIEWMRNNSKMMREKSALDNIYRLFDDGGDGVHSFHEFESMFRHVDPNITTRLALQYFNKTLDANRRKAALEQERIEEVEQEKKRIEKAKMKTISVGKKEKETVEEEESDDEDVEEERQQEWESRATPKKIMLFHTLHANEALVELKSKLVRQLVEGAVEKKYKPLEFVFHQDDNGDGMYIVEEGSCVVLKRDKETKNNDNTNYLEVAYLHVGAILGEMALLNEAPRNAAVKSGKDGCVCTFISHDLFAEIQCVTGGALGRNMSAINQLISFDDWVQLIWKLGYHQPEINGPWEMLSVGEY